LTHVRVNGVTIFSKTPGHYVEIGGVGWGGAAIVGSQIRDAEEHPPVKSTRETAKGQKPDRNIWVLSSPQAKPYLGSLRNLQVPFEDKRKVHRALDPWYMQIQVELYKGVVKLLNNPVSHAVVNLR
jgi:hypothetical protein